MQTVILPNPRGRPEWRRRPRALASTLFKFVLSAWLILSLTSQTSAHAKDDDNRPKAQDVERVELPVLGTIARPRREPGQSVAAPRQALDTAEERAEWDWVWRMLIAAGRSPVTVQATRPEAGVTLVRVLLGDNRAADGQALQQAGFQLVENAKTPGTWERRVSEADRATLEEWVTRRCQEPDVILRRLRERSVNCQPGRVLSVEADGGRRWAPGRLTFTDYPMDIAPADGGKAPELFVTVDSAGHPGLKAGAPAFLRGGRLHVSDGAVMLEGFRLAGAWQPVPAEAQQLVVRGDGRVHAQMPDGTLRELGRMVGVRMKEFSGINGVAVLQPEARAEPLPANSPPWLLSGHLETPVLNWARETESLERALELRRIAESIKQALTPTAAVAPAAGPGGGPMVIYAALPLVAEHLKALNIATEGLPGRTVIGAGNEQEVLAAALVKVMQVLRMRMALHEENLRNADKIRDDKGRISPYRRKLIKIGPQGNAVEELDPTPLPKSYDKGNPDADAEGFVTLTNVNASVEIAEFNSVVEEYKLVRIALGRLSPWQIFPDPPATPTAPPPTAKKVEKEKTQ